MAYVYNPLAYSGFSPKDSGGGPPPPPTGVTPNVEYRTLSSGEAASKSIVLLSVPYLSSYTVLDILGGTSQQYSVDYSVTGNTLSWNGLALDGLLSAGDTLRVIYWT